MIVLRPLCTLAIVTYNSTTVTCYCTTAQVNGTMVAGFCTTSTGDSATTRTPCSQISARNLLANVTTADVSKNDNTRTYNCHTRAMEKSLPISPARSCDVTGALFSKIAYTFVNCTAYVCFTLLLTLRLSLRPALDSSRFMNRRSNNFEQVGRKTNYTVP